MNHPTPPWFDQEPSRLRFGWGPDGLRRLGPGAAVVVIVDVLSFSTSVDVALGRGAIILPYRWHDGSEVTYAEANGALLARRGRTGGELPPGYTLRPSSLTTIEPGTRLVLPSPNGSALTFGAAGDQERSQRSVLVGCLRNATAVGRAAADLAGATPGPNGDGAGAVAVIAAGERWQGTTGPLRPAVEDLIGAGAILDAAASVLGPGERSPEAAAAVAAHRDAAPEIEARLLASGSGRELVGRGFPADVELASAADVSAVVPALVGAELVSAAGLRPRGPGANA